MLATNLAPSGPIIQTTEQVRVLFDAVPDGGPTTVTFAVLSPLKPGSMVDIVVDEDVNPTFLLMRAGVTALHQVKATFYVIIGFPDPTNYDLHVQISAHELSQCG